MDMEAALRSERATLVKADVDLREGEDRIRRQQDLIEGLQAGGHDTREAERFLTLLRQTLVQWQGHRALMLERIAYLEMKIAEAGQPGPG